MLETFGVKTRVRWRLRYISHQLQLFILYNAVSIKAIPDID